MFVLASVLAACGSESGSGGADPATTPLIAWSNGPAAFTANGRALNPEKGQVFTESFASPASSTFFLAYDVTTDSAVPENQGLIDGHLDFINAAPPAAGTYTQADFGPKSAITYVDRSVSPTVTTTWTNVAGNTLSLTITELSSHVLHGTLTASKSGTSVVVATF